MSLIPRRFPFAAGLLLAATTILAAAEPTAGTSEVKRITDRYALTRTRIHALLDQRLNPVPLPANPPNPFYQAPKESPTADQKPLEEIPVPELADISDIDSLKRHAANLKVGGVITRNDNSYVTLNGVPCKAGDIINLGTNERPVYVKIVSLNSFEFTLGLNEATLTVPLKK